MTVNNAHAADIITKQALLEQTEAVVTEKQAILALKKSELETIIEETRKEEDALKRISESTTKIVDERLLQAYRRLRDAPDVLEAGAGAGRARRGSPRRRTAAGGDRRLRARGDVRRRRTAHP